MAFESDDELDADMIRAMEESRILFELSQQGRKCADATSSKMAAAAPLNQDPSSGGDYEYPDMDWDEEEQIKLAEALSKAEFDGTQQKQTTFDSVSSNIAVSRPSTFTSAQPQLTVNTPVLLPQATSLEDLPGFDIRAGRTWIYPTNYSIRMYQRQIVETALFNNTLVSLPTGLGKTFIAAVVMYNFYRWYPQAKIVFMAPTKPLVAQQIEACFNIVGIPLDVTAKMTGTSKPEERKQLWSSKRVFFLTPQVLSNDLKSGFCQPYTVKCLVIDEAHKALGKHSYCEAVAELQRANANFRVLALSATPGSDVQSIQKVIQNLLISKIELRTETSPEMQAYSHERDIQKVVIPLGPDISRLKERYVEIMSYFARRLIQHKVLLGQDIGSMTMFAIRSCREVFSKTPVVGMNKTTEGILQVDFAMCMTLAHGLELLQKHGVRSLYKYILKVLSGSEGNAVRTAREFYNYQPFQRFMEDIKAKVEPGLGEENAFFMGHPKLERLQVIVLQHFKSCEAEKKSTRVMIFSQYRESVEEITKMLQQHTPLIKAMSFLGQSNKGSSRGTTQKKQIEVVKNFKKGGYNTLICTCVGEEGLDIGEVDLIICYDASKSPITLVQRMGRTGRKRKGRVVVLVTQGKEENAYNQSVYQQKSLCKSMLQGDKLRQFFYAQNPRMVPKGLDPVCHEMPMTMGDYQAAEDKPGSSTATSLSKGKQRKLPLFSSVKKPFLTPEEEADYERNFKMAEPTRQLSLNKYLPWQDELQPTIQIGHSSSTVVFVEALKLTTRLKHQDEDVYGMEMAAFLNPEDVSQLEEMPLQVPAPCPETPEVVVIQEPDVMEIDPNLPQHMFSPGASNVSTISPLRDPRFLALFKSPVKAGNGAPHQPRTPPWNCLKDINALTFDSLLPKRKLNAMETPTRPSADDFKYPSPFGRKLASHKRFCSTPISATKLRGKFTPDLDNNSSVLQLPVLAPDLSPIQHQQLKKEGKENVPEMDHSQSLLGVTEIINIVNDIRGSSVEPMETCRPSQPETVQAVDSDDDVAVNFDLGIDFLFSSSGQSEKSNPSPPPTTNLVNTDVIAIQHEASMSAVAQPLPTVNLSETKEESPILAKRRNAFVINSQSPVTKQEGGTIRFEESDEESPVFTRKRKFVTIDSPFKVNNVDVRGKVVEGNKNPATAADSKRREKSSKARRFLDMEANVSSDVVVSSDESTDEVKAYDASFVDDGTQVDHSEMQNIYRKSVRSPTVQERVIRRPIHANIFSQMPSQDDDYEHDSFCVNGSTEEEHIKEEEPSTLTVEETPPKKSRIIRPVLESSEEEDGLRHATSFAERDKSIAVPQILEEKRVKPQIAKQLEQLQQPGIENWVRARVEPPKWNQNLAYQTVQKQEEEILKMPVLSNLSREERLRKQKEQQERNRTLSLLRNTSSKDLASTQDQVPTLGNSAILATRAAVKTDQTYPSCTTSVNKIYSSIPVPSASGIASKLGRASTSGNLSNVSSRIVTPVPAVNGTKPTVQPKLSPVVDVPKPISLPETQISQSNGPVIKPLQTGASSVAGTPVILVDSKQIQLAGDIISHLRNTYKTIPQIIYSLSGADFVLSPRMAVIRRLYSDFSNGGSRAKLLDHCRQLMVLFDRPCLLIENDRIKEEKLRRGSEPTPQYVAKPHTKYVDMMFAALAQTHIRVLHSSSQQESAELLFLLTLQECQKSFTVPEEVKNEKLLPFLMSVPEISYVTAMVMCNTFLTLRELCNTPVDVLARRTKISVERARRIQDYVRKSC